MLIGRGPGLERLDRSRIPNILSQEDVTNGKTTNWPELEITGTIKNLSPALWKLQHLTALYLNDNSLFRIPSSISLLHNLKRLDISNNKPAEAIHRLPTTNVPQTHYWEINTGVLRRAAC